MVGQDVSHYRVLQELGRGGMGMVFRAEDTRLGRQVALKFLPPELSHDPEALARFQREARLASSLNHPNICTVHDIGQHGRRPYIVMELLEGKTLRQAIDHQPLPVEQTLKLAEQTSEALEAAHRRGIIHRDIKPANLFVTPRGDVKVLDFGLAKLGQEFAANTGTSPLPDDLEMETVDDELTNPGIRVGTMAYMSPEQARGEPLDARTDIFSFGAVLYEMATGRRAFPGDGTALVLYQILHATPIPPSLLNPGTPPALERIIRKAMEKDREVRYRDVGAMLADLRALGRDLDSEGLTTIGVQPLSQQAVEATPVRTAMWARKRWVWLAAGAAAIVSSLAAAAGFGYLGGGRVGLGERDSILMAGFTNHTGDQVFDGTLAQALSVQLSQSPFLNIVPEERVNETLPMMGRSPDDTLTHPVARELCQRLGVKAMLEGSIARVGNLYVLSVDATNCASGESLAREQEQTESKDQVLQALGRISSSTRRRLGESLRSLQQFDTPIEQATTPSLEALKSYTLGVAQRSKGEEIESIPFFRRAIELDPNFASAYTVLSTVYGGLGEWARSEEYARQAYARRNQVSERERLFITHQYHDRVTGDQLRAAEALDVWKASFPRDFRAPTALALIYDRLGLYDRAVQEAREALARNPGHPFPLSNLAYAYRGLNRYADAIQVGEQALKLNVATVPTRRLLYQLAVLANDKAAEQAQLEWARGRPREFDLVSAQAQVLAYYGRMEAARALFRQVIDLAERQGLGEVASGAQAQLMWTEALYGNPEDAAEESRRVAAVAGGTQSLIAGPLPRFRAVGAMALIGETRSAEAVLQEALSRYPESTLVRTVFVPVTRAALAINAGRPDEGLEALRAAAPYEFGTVAGGVPAFVRAQVYLAQRSGANAVAELERLLAHRGADPFSPIFALAQLGQARAHALTGDHAKSAEAYRQFFDLWRDADRDLPVLRQARAEYSKITE